MFSPWLKNCSFDITHSLTHSLTHSRSKRKDISAQESKFFSNCREISYYLLLLKWSFTNKIQHRGWFIIGLGLRLWCLALWSVLLVQETGVTVENHRHPASICPTLSHNVISSTPHMSGIRAHNVSGVMYRLHR